jgi:hypothetical protein
MALLKILWVQNAEIFILNSSVYEYWQSLRIW